MPTSTDDEKVKLLPDRSGIRFRDRDYAGFPDLDEFSPRARLVVARWAGQLAPETLTPGQRGLLGAQPPRQPSPARLEAARQDEALSSPPVRGLWRELSEEEQRLVLHPEDKVGHYYPLQTREFVDLTGLTARQVQHWTERNLLPHWRDKNSHRRFGSAAVVVAFALRDSKQHQRQFFSNVGGTKEPLREVAETMNIALLQVLDRAGEATVSDIAHTLKELEVISSGLRDMVETMNALFEQRRGARDETLST